MRQGQAMATIKALHIEIGAKSTQFRKEMLRVKRDIKNFRSALNRVGNSTMKFGRNIGRLTSSVTSFAKSAGLLGVALGAGVVAATKRFATFEQNLLRVQVLTGATEEDFAKLKSTAEKMGMTTAFSASEAASAMVVLAQQGRTAAQSMSMLPSVLNLAVVGALELADSAKLIGVTLNQFGLGVGEAGRVADVLAKGSTIAATEVSEIGEALEYSANLAQAFGLSLEETVAIITALASRGIVASKAGRGLTAVFAALGKEMRTNEGGLIGALRDMEAAGSPVDEILRDLGKQAGRAAVPLAGLTDEILSNVEALRKSGGTTKNFAEKILAGAEGAFVRLGSAFDGFVNKMGEVFAPFIMGVFDSISSALERGVQSMTMLKDELGLTQEAGEGFAAAMLAGIETFIVATQQMLQNISRVGNFIQILLSPFRALGIILLVAAQNIVRAAALVASITDFLGLTDGLADDLFFEADVIGGAIDELANDIVDTFTEAFNGMESETVDFLEGLGNKIAQIRNTFKTQRQIAEEESEDPTTTTGEGDGSFQSGEGTPAATLESEFPNIAELLGEMPASLKEITDAIIQHPRNIDGLQQKIAENLFESGITVDGLKELVETLDQLKQAMDEGFLTEKERNKAVRDLIDSLGGFAEGDDPFKAVKDFIDGMDASQQDLKNLAATLGLSADETQRLLEEGISNEELEQLKTVLTQAEEMFKRGLIDAQTLAGIKDQIKEDVVPDTEEMKDIQPEGLQTALGTIKVDPLVAQNQARQSNAIIGTQSNTAKIARNTAGLNKVLR